MNKKCLEVLLELDDWATEQQVEGRSFERLDDIIEKARKVLNELSPSSSAGRATHL